ncbi:MULTISPECIES: PD-(D/E)XK nuclease family protein [unclassified Haloferax]|uniref:PD-(D/E)XK nuclease family protein n=1 Tax=unclassified Haloferax TaxID=2625095 RepID=UPI0028760CC9|nr:MULTISPECIES: PD-(D/E)XK nuclease family protein [unclassified Haloferax]MDS0243552.1 PD-(D/E)XK nuclease family protein [Haloferax sp. S2CR25]MDS0446673.1 PD-(D/E)XK nuclease family protein [Haloferax sp. S2CR25-2]
MTNEVTQQASQSVLFHGPDAEALDDAAFQWAHTHSSGLPESILYLTNQPHRETVVETQWQEVGRPAELVAMSLDDFVDRCYDRTAIGGPSTRIDQPTRQRLMERAIESLPEESPLHSDRDGLPSTGLTGELEDLFSLLEFAGVLDVDTLQQRLRGEGLPNLADELGRVAAEFYGGRDDIEDGSGTVLQAERYQHVESIDPSSIFEHVDAVIVAGFDRFSVLAERVVATVADTWPTAGTVVRLTDTDEPVGVDVAADRAWSFFNDDLEFEAQHIPSRSDLPRENAKLAASLFRREGPTIDNTELTADFVVPSSLEAEVRFVGRQVQQLVGEGVDLDDIAVVPISSQAYVPALAAEFESRRIRYAANKQYDVDETATGTALIAALDLVMDDDPDALAKLVDNPVVTFGEWWPSGQSRREVHDVITEAVESDDFDDGISQSSDEVEQFVSDVRVQASTIQTSDAPLAEFRAFILDLGIDETVENRETTGSQRVVRSGVRRVLDAVDRTAADRGGVLERARHALSGASVTDTPRGWDDRVDIIDAGSVGARAYDYVFVVGLTASHFPGGNGRLALYQRVTDAHEDFEEADHARRAEYRIAGLLGSSASIVFSRPSKQLDGTKYVDASILAELRRVTDTKATVRDEFENLFDSTVPHRDVVGSRGDLHRAFSLVGVSGGKLAVADAIETAESGGVFEMAPGANDTLARPQSPSSQNGVRTASSRDRAQLDDRNGWLSEATATVLSLEPKPLSPTAAEDYAACPFKYYARRVLELDDDDETTVPMARGTVVHDILEAFYERLAEQEGRPVPLGSFSRSELEGELLEVALSRLRAADETEREALDEEWRYRHLAGLGTDSSNPYYTLPGIEAEASGIFVRFLDEEVRFHVDPDDDLRDGPVTVAPYQFEQRLSGSVGSVDMFGYLDRQDRSGGGLAVIRDYKTGKTPSERDTLDGIKFQLPVYAKLLEQTEDVEVVGGTYYRLRKPGDVSSNAGQVTFDDVAAWYGHGGTPTVRGRTPAIETGDGFRELLDEAVPDRLSQIVDGIESGVFHPTPNKEDAAGCSSCAFRDACDVRHHRRRDLVANLESAERDAYVPPMARGVEWEPTVERDE